LQGSVQGDGVTGGKKKMKGKRSINRRLGSDALVEDHQQNLTTRETGCRTAVPATKELCQISACHCIAPALFV